MKPEVVHSNRFVEDAADFIARRAVAAVSERGAFRIALSGGNTPRPVYARLAAMPHIPWEKFIVTYGDERCVPPDDGQSNYKMSKDALLSSVPIPAENILRVRGEIDPDAAALEYEEKLAARAIGEARYVHDLLLLGLGRRWSHSLPVPRHRSAA